MTPLLLPYTLITASVLAIVAFVLGVQVGRVRYIVNALTGDGGVPELANRVETQASFTHYVPLLLVLMALLELGAADTIFLAVFGGLLILFRLLHILGMRRNARNPQFHIGNVGSALLLIVGAGYGFYLANSAF